MSDLIRHPAHYTAGGIEAWDVILALGLGFELGNVLKYVSRAGKKHNDRITDLNKARAYVERAEKLLQRGVNFYHIKPVTQALPHSSYVDQVGDAWELDRNGRLVVRALYDLKIGNWPFLLAAMADALAASVREANGL